MPLNLALEFVQVTNEAAMAAGRWIGRGDKNAADKAAVDAMRSRLNEIDFQGVVVIGEGEKDNAPELYKGEKVGSGTGIEVDIAVDPLECTNSVAYGTYNALSVVVTGPRGSLLSAPDLYMDKLAAWGPAAKVLDLDAPAEDNVKRVAQALKKTVSEVTVMILDRDRHQELIHDVRHAGAKVRLISDGDIASAISTCLPDSEVDLIMGVGASAEAVLAAAAVKMLGGEMLCRFQPRDEVDEQKLAAAGIVDLKEIYRADDLASGDQLTFTATGIITGSLLEGVIYEADKTITHSLVIRGRSGTVRYITTHHKKH